MRPYTVPSNDSVMTSPEPGLRRQVMSIGEHMMLVRHLQAKGWKGARHQHPHEQLLYVASGSVLLKIAKPNADDLVFTVSKGESIMIPGATDHEAEALEDSEVLDVFSPPRDDYR